VSAPELRQGSLVVPLAYLDGLRDGTDEMVATSEPASLPYHMATARLRAIEDIIAVGIAIDLSPQRVAAMALHPIEETPCQAPESALVEADFTPSGGAA
jgi:hypothetical protein